MKKSFNRIHQLIAIESAIFVIVAAISTYRAAKVDAGSFINDDPIHDVGHYMGMGEAIWRNIPLGIFEGLLAVLVIGGVYYLAKKVVKLVREIKG